MNDSKKMKLVQSIIRSEKEKVTRFLSKNLEISATDLAKEMAVVGVPLLYISLITGVPAEEIHRLTKVIH